MLPFVLTVLTTFVGADPQSTAAATPDVPLRSTVERGLKFLIEDAAKWRADHECATCHHGAMTVWALNEAHQRGMSVTAETLADVSSWTKERWLKDIDQPRDPRPGWNLVKLPMIYLAFSAQQMPERNILSRDELAQALGHIARHQEIAGFWSTPPPKNGPPPVFESPETFTLWANLAMGDRDQTPSVVESRKKAGAWLSAAPRGEDLQAALLRLTVDVRAEQPPAEIQGQIESVLKRQQADGGWGQVKDSASDAFATGQALYFLCLAGLKPDRPEIGRAVAFLAAQQKEDGGWPMTSRAQPGEKPFTNPVPITYFGSAWATLGLVRCLPEP